jgi:hypothetical protein
MKSIRILNIISKRVLRFRSLVLCGLGAGLFVTHAATCAVSWHPLHGLLAAGALLFLALEVHGAASVRRVPGRNGRVAPAT